MDVEQHYESLLAEVYDWMQGGWSARLASTRELFEAHALRGPGVAVDLGAGTGYQTIALAQCGFEVLAVDLSASMLRQLEARASGLDVRTELADLRRFPEFLDGPASLIVCMGDTLTHLPNRAAASEVVERAADNLATDGRVLLQFRDLSQLPAGDARFLPIRSADDRLFTCFLEEVSNEHVRVHDLLHVRKGEGFEQRVSSYLKTRLDASWLDDALAAAGLKPVSQRSERGLITCIAGA